MANKRGVGRPPKDGQKRERIDARLPPKMVAWLKQNGITETIEKLVEDKMDERETKRKQAERRIDGMNFTETEQDTIWADWPNIDEHYDWLLTASRAEIVDWVIAQR